MRVYVDFFYVDDTVAGLYKDNPYVLAVNYNNLNNSKTGAVYLIDNKKVDFNRMGLKFITIDLDEEFLDFYLRNLYNPEFDNIDFRAYWFINKLEPENEKYFIKYVREAKFIFSKTPICEQYTNLEIDRNVRIACTNDAFTRKETDHKYYCLQHISIT